MMTLVCYCGAELSYTPGEYDECPNCYASLEFETSEEIETHNWEIRQAIDLGSHTGKVLITAIQETGESRVLRKVDEDPELVELIMAGYKMLHPEWEVFSEREINQNYLVAQQLLHE